MEVKIQEYHVTDRQQLIRLMEILQDFLANIDPLHRLRRLPAYGEVYAESLFRRIRDSAGIIYLAKQGQDAVGCIAGVIEVQSEADRVGAIPSQSGRILELVVEESYRGQGIGLKLMKRIEDYFRVNGCDIVRVEVFVPNTAAHAFYSQLQYNDRTFDMIKRL
jgi:ribosomal protein S18 acetylase RimI-like enzyme